MSAIFRHSLFSLLNVPKRQPFSMGKWSCYIYLCFLQSHRTPLTKTVILPHMKRELLVYLFLVWLVCMCLCVTSELCGFQESDNSTKKLADWGSSLPAAPMCCKLKWLLLSKEFSWFRESNIPPLAPYQKRLSDDKIKRSFFFSLGIF